MHPQIATQQVQKTILASVMQNSIEILLLPLAELHQSIEQEIQENPLLEIDEDASAGTAESGVLSQKIDDWLKASPRLPLDHFTDDEAIEEQPVKTETSLEDELLRQIHIELSDPLDIKIGEHIIGNLDEDGYLKTTCEDIAAALRIEDAAHIERVLKLIQEFAPPGIAARTLAECLRIQIRNKNLENRDFLCRLIDEHLNDLGRKKFQVIARKMGVSLTTVQEAGRLIAALEPRPARNYRPVYASIYIKPDILITKNNENTYQIEINKEGILPLRINPYYKNLLNQNHLSPEDRRFICEKIKKAADFIKSIKQRSATLRTIAEYILARQKSFFEHGCGALTPMTLKDVAQAIGRNESTVSRAVSNKFIDTPQGTYPVKFFFSQGIPENGAPTVASRSIKEEIKELIERENKSSPLSDQDIQEYFIQRNMRIARRTINKYRQTLKILPSSLRRI